MRFDDSAVDASQLDDRRGMGTAGMVGLGGGGLGIVGLILALVLGVNPFAGSDGSATGPGGTGSGGTATGAGDVAARCNTAGAIERDDDCYVLKVFNEVNEVWAAELPSATGTAYALPRLVFFEGAVRTGCGSASSAAGPFYCPPDRRVYIDLGFLAQLQEQFGAQGRYAQAYIVAHEVGHHVQTLLGTEARVRAAQQRDPSQTNALSVRLELQADCYAGVYGRLANDRGNQTITDAELAEALRAAAAVGDDRIQSRSGQVDPESFTHGSAAQRQQWFTRGYTSGRPADCDTFG